jgi:minor histocompatibility antigen H13
LIIPNFIATPIGIQLLLNATAVVTIGTLLSVDLRSEAKDGNVERIDEKDPNEEEEVLGVKDALAFPLMASVSLLGIYFVLKIFNKELISYLFKGYFSFIGVHVLGLFFTNKVIERKPDLDKHVLIDKTYPIKIPYVMEKLDIYFTKASIIGYSIGLLICLAYVVTGFWVLNNIIGISFTVAGIRLLKFTSFKIGLIALWGLFIYDIWWVFYTDVMISVAKGVDGPILLKFLTDPVNKKYSMLGLGDMVIPGAFVSLCLKFDVDRAIASAKKLGKSTKFSEIKTPFFIWNLGFYILGIFITYIYMVWFNHPQPALLYLVPCATVGLAIPALQHGVIKSLWDYEAVEAKPTDEKDK